MKLSVAEQRGIYPNDPTPSPLPLKWSGMEKSHLTLKMLSLNF